MTKLCVCVTLFLATFALCAQSSLAVIHTPVTLVRAISKVEDAINQVLKLCASWFSTFSLSFAVAFHYTRGVWNVTDLNMLEVFFFLQGYLTYLIINILISAQKKF